MAGGTNNGISLGVKPPGTSDPAMVVAAMVNVKAKELPTMNFVTPSDPANSYVNRVMDRRRGIPISLSAVYLFVGRRLGLPVAGIGLPGHFLCRYQTSREEIYIDAFNGGKLLDRADCRRRIETLAVEHDDSHLAPVTSRRMLQRMIANLHLLHKEKKQRAEAERLQRHLVALSR